MKKILDDFLNSITMYKLVLYYLIGLITFAIIFSYVGLLAFNPASLIFEIIFLLVVGVITNNIFSSVFQATANSESSYISVLILTLIISPPTSLNDLPFLFWAAVWTMAGKFIIAVRNKHIFNPVALGVLLPSLFLNHSASWWVGTLPMLVPVLVGGVLILRKTQREEMVGMFILSAVLSIMALSFSGGPDLISLMKKIFADSAILFFGFVMLTEPLTTPPTKNLRSFYAVLVGILYAPQIHIGNFYTTPELALAVGNIYSFLVGFKERLTLTLKEKIQIAPDIFDYIFTTPRNINFTPGQYLEWTLAHPHIDSRGNRRYFSIASSPTESDVRIGVKFYSESSSYKKAMLSLKKGDKISATSLAGDFTLPKDANNKYVFIAGGIGITPFRSVLKYLTDTNKKLDIVLFYANKKAEDIVYKDVLMDAEKSLGIKVIYILSDKENIPSYWTGRIGRIDQEVIKNEVPDYKERMYYLSGPHAMVDAYYSVLRKMNLNDSQIVTDYFPGFA